MTSPMTIARVASSRVTGIAFLSDTEIGSFGEDGIARTEAHHLPEPEQILLVVGPIETEILAELRQLLLADVAGLAHQGDQRVARHDAHQAEDDQRREQ